MLFRSGEFEANNDPFAFNGNFTTAPGVSFVGDRFNQGSSLRYPSDSFGYVPAWFGGNISLQQSYPPATSSTPGPLPLVGAAAAYGWSRRLRIRVFSKHRQP